MDLDGDRRRVDARECTAVQDRERHCGVVGRVSPQG
jgi:hypothetical protein